MGQFQFSITAVGGHGCQREVTEGNKVYGCRRMTCPDCRIREFVEDFQKRFMVEQATLTHWPGTENEVVDDLLTRVRKGNF